MQRPTGMYKGWATLSASPLPPQKSLPPLPAAQNYSPNSGRICIHTAKLSELRIPLAWVNCASSFPQTSEMCLSPSSCRRALASTRSTATLRGPTSMSCPDRQMASRPRRWTDTAMSWPSALLAGLLRRIALTSTDLLTLSSSLRS